MKYVTTVEDQEYAIEIIEDEDAILVDGVRYQYDFAAVGDQPVFTLLLSGKSYEAYVYESAEGLKVLLQGTMYPATVIDEREQRLRSALGSQPSLGGEFYLKAPMPGLIVDVPVEEGQAVEKGQVLLILESMKMQNELKSPRKGIVSRLRVDVGDNVERKETLLSVV